MSLQHRRMSVAALVLSSITSGLADVGHAALDRMSAAVQQPSFGGTYGNNPRPKNGGHGRGAAARIKRAAKKRRNIRKRA